MGATAAEKTSSEAPTPPPVAVAPSKPAMVSSSAAASNELILGEGMEAPQACSILEPDCEACQ